MGALLALGGVLLVYYGEMNTMDPWYLLLLVVTTGGLSFTVGYVLGYLADKGLGPSSEGRE
ncbi:MAG: hypothetical protein JSW25_04180 [Thermoplasmata archaeon]|nr:MAG: hypothetical protein JSW25_04180 [Thermoplasmata archaeon]